MNDEWVLNTICYSDSGGQLYPVKPPVCDAIVDIQNNNWLHSYIHI